MATEKDEVDILARFRASKRPILLRKTRSVCRQIDSPSLLAKVRVRAPPPRGQPATFLRNGVHKWNLFHNTGSSPIQHQGELPDNCVKHLGGEIAEPQPQPGDQKDAYESAVLFCDGVEALAFKGLEGKHPYTNRPFSLTKGHFMVQSPRFGLRAGQRRVGDLTIASADFSIVGSDTFTYYPPSGGAKEVFLGVMKPAAVSSENFKTKGTAYLKFVNEKTGRVLRTIDLNAYHDPDGTILYMPLSYYLEWKYAGFVSPGDVIRVEIVQQCQYSHSTRQMATAGAYTTLGLHLEV